MTISAVLLTGGKSRRMGRDKATTEFRDKPLWQTQLQLLRELEPPEIFVSAQTDPPWRPPDVRFVADEKPDCGPLGGIFSVLSRMTSTHLLALAIDMPFMTEEYFRELCAQIGPHAGAVPVIGDRAEPLAAIYPREAFPEFSSALAEGGLSLQPLVRKLIESGKLRPVTVPPEKAALFRNMNEPSDLNRG